MLRSVPDLDSAGDEAAREPTSTADPTAGSGVPEPIKAQISGRDLSHLLGTTLAEKYRIDEILGAGGMGTVFSAHHLLLKRDVAVKVLHPDLGENPDIRERFDREAQSAARLEHPNIVHVSEYGSTETGIKFMVMQLLEGHELIEELGEKMDPARVFSLAGQLFSGLEHAHQNGVIHRDLKPENVYVTRNHEDEEVIKLVDFGIAKLVLDDDEKDQMRTLTQLGMVFGTPRYMSPEQATGSPIDPRTDLYSAGVILYEMLAGDAPFDNDDPVALVRMQVTAEPPALDPSIPGDLAAIVYRLLEKRREDRFPDATAVRAALDLVGARMAAGESAKTVATPAQRARKRELQRRWLPIAAAVGVVGVGIAIFSNLDDTQVDRPTAPPVEMDAPAPEGTLAFTDEDLDKIDKEILSKQPDAALALIKPLLDRFPKHPTLLWRQGRALAQQRAKRGLALRSYSDALEESPGLLDDNDFYAELFDLMGDRRLRDQALDLAVQRMGKVGHKFLLLLVNEPDPKKALDFEDRHRALEVLAKDPDSAPLVDHKLNLARDLWQSSRGGSTQPCEDFRVSLDRIAESSDSFFAPGLRRAKVPKDPEAPLSCQGLDQRLEEVLAAATALEEAAAAETGTGGEGE
jgi:serine/threonine protein kinase